MRYEYNGQEFVEFQRRVIKQGGDMEIVNITPGTDGVFVEVPQKPPYKETHREVYDTKPSIHSETRDKHFKGIEDDSSVSEEDDIRDPGNPSKKISILDFNVEKFAVFGNGSVFKIPILGV